MKELPRELMRFFKENSIATDEATNAMLFVVAWSIRRWDKESISHFCADFKKLVLSVQKEISRHANDSA